MFALDLYGGPVAASVRVIGEDRKGDPAYDPGTEHSYICVGPSGLAFLDLSPSGYKGMILYISQFALIQSVRASELAGPFYYRQRPFLILVPETLLYSHLCRHLAFDAH